jgi:hypothetical protein
MNIRPYRVIASVSLGASRTFIMTHDPPKPAKSTASKKKKTRAIQEKGSDPTPSSDAALATLAPPGIHKKRWTLDHGSLVVMQGDTQRYWKHEIPKSVAPFEQPELKLTLPIIREPKIKEGRISLTFRQLIF